MSAMSDDLFDSEIADIFVEEAAEVLQNIDKYLPVWKGRPTDREALAEIRRGFHTLKGSGRMAKALDLGELAWKVENMLNRGMDGAVPVSESMVKLVATSRNLMPRLLDAFKNRQPAAMDPELESLMRQADAIATGQPLKPAAPRRSPTLGLARDSSGVPVKTDALDRRFERHAQRADEALHRAEMALQQVRRLAVQINNVELEAQERVSRTEITQISDRVQIVTKELLQLREVAKGLAQPAMPHPRELQQVIDRRVSAKLAPVERSHSEVQRQLEDSSRVASSARRLAMTTMILTLLFAGAAAGLLFLLAGSPVP